MLPEPAGPSRRRPALEALGVVALALTLNLAGNGRTSLWDRDEPRYAQCAREMRQSGDYLRPTYNGEPRNHKPVLIYWLMLAGTALGGDTPFGARLVSAAAGACSCLLIWGLGGRMLGRSVGLMAALILATSPLMLANSKLATTDATLALFLLVGQCALWELRQRPSKVAAGAFWVSLALAMLTKGPVGPALIAASGLFARWWGGPSPCWRRLEWRWGVSLFVLVAGPWYAAIGVATRGEFFRFSIGTQIVQRIATTMEQHGGLPGYYPATLLLTFYPWSALLPAALLALWTRRKLEPAGGFLLGWAVGPMVLLECSRTKLFHYYLPALPACALTVAWLLQALAQSELNLRRWPLGRLALALLAGTGLGLAVAMAAGAWFLPGPARFPCLIMAATLAGGTLWAIEGFHVGRSRPAALRLVGTWGVILLAFGGWFLPSLEPFRLSGIVARRLDRLAAVEQADPILATYKEPSIIYAMGRPVGMLIDRPTLYDRLVGRGTVVTAFTDRELAFMRKDRMFDIQVRETVRGLGLSNGLDETLSLVVIRPVAAIAGRPAGWNRAPVDDQVGRARMLR